jgi:hypothetical protein
VGARERLARADRLIAMPVPAAPPPPAIVCTAEKPGKPPLDYLTCDVSVANDGDSLRWFLVQSSFYVPQQDSAAKIDGVTAHALGTGTVLELHGSSAAWAIAVAPHESTTVRGLPLQMWGRPEIGQKAAVKIVTATDARIGEQALAAFGGQQISGEQWWSAAHQASGGRFPKYEARPFVTVDASTQLVEVELPGPGSSASRGMEKIRTLAGTWNLATFEHIARGKFVMQRSVFVVMYQQDGESILATLFPDDGYQARYRSTGLAAGSDTMEFRLVDNTLWSPPQTPPAKSFTLKITDASHADQLWQFTANGKPAPLPLSLTRKPAK